METKEWVGHADDCTFESAVLKTDRPALVDFWAPWCGPCRALAPVLEEIGKAYDGRANVIKVNVDESPKTAANYGVQSYRRCSSSGKEKSGKPSSASRQRTNLRRSSTGTFPNNRMVAA